MVSRGGVRRGETRALRPLRVHGCREAGSFGAPKSPRPLPRQILVGGPSLLDRVVLHVGALALAPPVQCQKSPPQGLVAPVRPLLPLAGLRAGRAEGPRWRRALPGLPPVRSPLGAARGLHRVDVLLRLVRGHGERERELRAHVLDHLEGLPHDEVLRVHRHPSPCGALHNTIAAPVP